MKRLAIVRGGVAMALMLGVLVAVAASAEASPSGQLRVYMRQGLSLERAQTALATQSQVETAELPTKLEEALGASFAGMWFEPSKGKFCIGVVSGASRRAAEQVVDQAGLAGVVSYVPVRSAWTQLISAKDEWNAKLEHIGWRQFSTGLTPSNNAVSVRLSSSVPEHERALIEREAARSHVNVSITVRPPEALVVRHDNSKCEFKRGENYAFCSKPIAAGVLISPNERGTEYCTAGPLAILANPATLAAELETLLITDGHCVERTERWWTNTHPRTAFEEIGSVVSLGVNGLAGDYGDIEVGPRWLQAGVTPALAQITNYQDNGLREALNVVGEAASVPGASFCRQGASTGEQCGEITAVEQLVLFLSGRHIDGLVITNACREGGDSGGPYETSPEGNSVRILGTHIGGESPACSELLCPTGRVCEAYYEPIRTSLAGLRLTLLTTANQTRHKSHPLFFTASGTELLFSGEGSDPVLRGEQAGIPATILCEKTVVDGFALWASTLAHRVLVHFIGKCVQKINGGANETCNEPILTKRILAELGLLTSTNHKVVLLLAPSDGTTKFAEINCGGRLTTIGGTIVGEVPERNKAGENQLNTLRSEIEVIFASINKTNHQSITEIFLLGTQMTKQELVLEGFFGGPASEEAAVNLRGDGSIEINTRL